MEELSDFLLDSKRCFSVSQQKNELGCCAVTEMKKEKKGADKIKKMVEKFIDENSFTIPI